MKKIQKPLCWITAMGLLLWNLFIINYSNNINSYANVNSDSYCFIHNSNDKNWYFSDHNNYSLNNYNNARTSDIMVYPGGKSLGMKINTKGPLVIALCDVETEKEKIKSPAAVTGILVGDSILNIDGKEIKSSEDISTMVNRCDGNKIKIIVERKSQQIEFIITPVLSKKDDKYKIGLWVRDSAAGVGTLTFYDDQRKVFGALGHPITDVDTGSIMTVRKGEVVSSNIVDVRKGVKGNPGELRGIFTNVNENLGNILYNTECGVFGVGNDGLICEKFNKKMKIAFKDEVKVGKAQIITTLQGNEPEVYDIIIERLIKQDEPSTKSMVIKVTDPRCLEKTGGIVQGMSGSPIIQNGKIVGAVTHVLVNKPDTGYGIYMDWMIEKSLNVK